MHELPEKLERVVRLCHTHRLGGILLTTQPNFAWITGGRSNRIDGSREPGNGAILITAEGRRFVVANQIEMPRLLDEALAGIPCEPIDYSWTSGLSTPSSLVELARTATSHSHIGADWPIPDTVSVEGAITGARALLTTGEIERYKVLGRDIGAAIGQFCRGLEPGLFEDAVARGASDSVAALGARATVVLVGADDRIARYRHPTPTPLPWRQLLMLVVCAERHGLVVAVTRLVSAGPAPSEVVARTEAAARVFERLLDATRTGATGREIYSVAAAAYAACGFPGEETRHHQGGPIGYQARDWLAHPSSDARVEARQAFAWNPSITGTKVEETALLLDDHMEIISGSPEWPSMEMQIRGRRLLSPLVLERR